MSCGFHSISSFLRIFKLQKGVPRLNSAEFIIQPIPPLLCQHQTELVLEGIQIVVMQVDCLRNIVVNQNIVFDRNDPVTSALSQYLNCIRAHQRTIHTILRRWLPTTLDISKHGHTRLDASLLLDQICQLACIRYTFCHDNQIAVSAIGVPFTQCIYNVIEVSVPFLR